MGGLSPSSAETARCWSRASRSSNIGPACRWSAYWPHEDPGLPEEDSLALPDPGDAAPWGDDDAPEARTVTVAVPRLPRASNVTDVEPLARVPGVRVRFVLLSAVVFRYGLRNQKALGALDSQDLLRSSVALLPVVLASSGFVESASPFQSARSQLIDRQKLARRSVLI